MNSAVIIVVLALFGAVIGSFCNVLIDRLPVELDEPAVTGELWGTRPWSEVLGGRSRCSTCGAAVRPIHNVPLLGWLSLRGRCRDCGDRIPVFHPLVELAVPLLWILMYTRLHGSWVLLPAMWLVPVGVTLAMIDFRTMIVPLKVVWPAFFVSVALSVVAALAAGHPRWLVSALIGLLVAAGPLFVIWYLLPTHVGFGDVRLNVLLGWNVGLAAGSLDPRLLVPVLLAVIMMTIGSVAGIVLGILMKVGFNQRLPFGPTLIFGAFACIAFVEPILRPYL